MTQKQKEYLCGFAQRSFRDTADADYIAARACYQAGLIDQFLWLGTQAIEKYLKAILLFYGKNTKGISHDLTKAINRVESIPDIHWDFSKKLKEFLEHLTEYGNNRYFVIPRVREGHELFEIDATVWSIRRYCESISYTKEWNTGDPDESFFDKRIKWLSTKECKKNPHSFQLMVKGYLEEVVRTNKHPEQRKHLVWKNLYYGQRKKRLVYHKKVKSFSQPSHFVQPEMFEFLSTKVEFYKKLKERFKKNEMPTKTR